MKQPTMPVGLYNRLGDKPLGPVARKQDAKHGKQRDRATSSMTQGEAQIHYLKAASMSASFGSNLA